MEDLKPLEWLNNISIVETEQKPIQVVVSSKKKKLSLEYLLKNFHIILNQFRSPTRRPTFSYATLILLALNFAPTKQCSLSQIYSWIKSTFPYYAAPGTSPAWKNSIRHNLSLNKCFVKIPRNNKTDKPGKGGFWKLDSNCEKKLMEGDNFYRLRKKRNKKQKKGSSGSSGGGGGKLSNKKGTNKGNEENILMIKCEGGLSPNNSNNNNENDKNYQHHNETSGEGFEEIQQGILGKDFLEQAIIASSLSLDMEIETSSTTSTSSPPSATSDSTSSNYYYYVSTMPSNGNNNNNINAAPGLHKIVHQDDQNYTIIPPPFEEEIIIETSNPSASSNASPPLLTHNNNNIIITSHTTGAATTFETSTIGFVNTTTANNNNSAMIMDSSSSVAIPTATTMTNNNEFVPVPAINSSSILAGEINNMEIQEPQQAITSEITGTATTAIESGQPTGAATTTTTTQTSTTITPPEWNELNIVLEEYYYDPRNGCFEELELDIEHLISIGGF